MAEKSCTGECLKCSFQQWSYCSAKRTYAMMRNQEVIVNRLDRLEQLLSRFGIEDIIPLEDNAQKDSGAENRESKILNPSSL